MKLRKMKACYGNYMAGLFLGILCANATRYFNGAEAVEKDVTAAMILWGIGIVLVSILSFFTRSNVTKINGKVVDLCDVEINTIDLPDNSVKVSVAGLDERGKKEAFEVMDVIKDLCGSVRGDAKEA